MTHETHVATNTDPFISPGHFGTREPGTLFRAVCSCGWQAPAGYLCWFITPGDAEAEAREHVKKEGKS